MQNFYMLISHSSCVDLFESYLVVYPKGRFSRDEAIESLYMSYIACKNSKNLNNIGYFWRLKS